MTREFAEYLMLVGAEEFQIRAGGSIDNRDEVHFESAVIACKGPRRHVILDKVGGINGFAACAAAAASVRGVGTVLHRYVEFYLTELVCLAVIKQHVFACG